MATSALIAQAVMADLGRSRQEELPLSNIDERGRSYTRPRVDESQHYDNKVKSHLNTKWSVAIHDDESEQMRGLTNLNARPWASSGPPAASVFDMPKLAKSLPAPKSASPAASRTASAEMTPSASSASTAQSNQPLFQILDQGKCQVSLREGSTVVPDASYSIAVQLQTSIAFFMVGAPGKPTRSHNVLNLKPPVVYGTSCIIQNAPGQEAAEYAIKPLEPATAERLALVLGNIQRAARKEAEAIAAAMPAEPEEPKPSQVSKAPAAKAVKVPCPLVGDSPESSPDQTPVLSQRQLVEFAVTKQKDKTTVDLMELIDDMTMVARSAYYQYTGLAQPISPTKFEQPGDLALSEWLQKGPIDSEADPTKRGLLEIMRFFRDMRIRATIDSKPIMSSNTMQMLQSLDRGIKNPGTQTYSATELLHLKKDAVVPKAARGGLGKSLWAKK